MQNKIDKAQKLLNQARVLNKMYTNIKDKDSIPVRHPVTGEEVELPVTKEMKDKLKQDLSTTIQEVKDEIRPLSVAEVP